MELSNNIEEIIDIVELELEPEAGNDATPPGSLGIEEGDEVESAPMRFAASPILVPTLAMSAACLASVMIASSVERRSPWAGLNAVAAGIGLAGRRPQGRFRASTTLAGLGIIVAGALVVAGLNRQIGRRVGGGRALRGVVGALASVALDKLVMRDALFGTLRKTMGIGGTAMKYAAIGAAAAASPG